MSGRMQETLKRIFTENLSLKLLSLVLAVVLFFLVRADRVVERTFTMPVVVSDKNKSKRFLISETPTEIKVRVRSRITKLRGLYDMTIPAYELNISSKKHSEKVYFDETEITRYLRISGLKVIEVVPASITLRFSNVVRRTLPVRVQFRGQVPNGYVRGPAKIKPRFIVAVGAENSVRQLRFVDTQPIELSGNVNDLKLTIGLESPPLGLVKFEPKNVQIQIPITPKVGKTRMQNIPVQVRNCNPKLRCTARPNMVDVYVEGPELDVRLLKKRFMQRYLYLEAQGLGTGEHRIQLIIRAHPRGLQFFTDRTHFILDVVDPTPKKPPEPPKPKPRPVPVPVPEPVPVPVPVPDVVQPPPPTDTSSPP